MATDPTPAETPAWSDDGSTSPPSEPTPHAPVSGERCGAFRDFKPDPAAGYPPLAGYRLVCQLTKGHDGPHRDVDMGRGFTVEPPAPLSGERDHDGLRQADAAPPLVAAERLLREHRGDRAADEFDRWAMGALGLESALETERQRSRELTVVARDALRACHERLLARTPDLVEPQLDAMSDDEAADHALLHQVIDPALASLDADNPEGGDAARRRVQTFGTDAAYFDPPPPADHQGDDDRPERTLLERVERIVQDTLAEGLPLLDGIRRHPLGALIATRVVKALPLAPPLPDREGLIGRLDGALSTALAPVINDGRTLGEHVDAARDAVVDALAGDGQGAPSWAVAKRERDDAYRERDEALAEVERLNRLMEGHEACCKRSEALLAAKPLTTAVLRRPSDELVEAGARAQARTDHGDEESWRVLVPATRASLAAIADWLDSQPSPPEVEGDGEPAGGLTRMAQALDNAIGQLREVVAIPEWANPDSVGVVHLATRQLRERRDAGLLSLLDDPSEEFVKYVDDALQRSLRDAVDLEPGDDGYPPTMVIKAVRDFLGIALREHTQDGGGGREPYDAANPTKATTSDLAAAVGRRASITLTGRIVDWTPRGSGGWVSFETDERWGLGRHRLGMDLEAFDIEPAASPSTGQDGESDGE